MAPGRGWNQPSEWINGSCKEGNIQYHYYEILDYSWQQISRNMTKGNDYYEDKNSDWGQTACGGQFESFDSLISKAKLTGKATEWEEESTKEDFLYVTNSEFIEKFPSSRAVKTTDKEIILYRVEGVAMPESMWELNTFAAIDRLTGAVTEPGLMGTSAITASCSAITKKEYKEVIGTWNEKVEEILKIEKDYLKHNRKF